MGDSAAYVPRGSDDRVPQVGNSTPRPAAVTVVGGVIARRYRLVTRIAGGGMGMVWEAWDELLLRRVAVKQLIPQPGMSADEVNLARERVIREARITARLHHPHAVTLYDVVDHDGYPSLIMQFVPSISLSTLLREQGVLTVVDAGAVSAQIASALAAAHEVGIVHRDVKPGNVLITTDGSAKLTDFGISHAVGDITLTAAGMVSGTPAFLAPEVARGGQSGPPADVFSLGATLYACLEGQPPFGRDPNPMAVLHRAASGRITPPHRSGPMTALLLQMMAIDPFDRPTMIEIADRLQRGVTASDIPPSTDAAADTLPHRKAKPVPPRPLRGAGVPDSSPTDQLRNESPERRRVTLIAVLAVALAAGVLTAAILLLDRGAGGDPQSAASINQSRTPTADILSAATPSPASASASGPAVPSAPPAPSTSPAALTSPSMQPAPTPPASEPSPAEPTSATPDSAPTNTPAARTLAGGASEAPSPPQTGPTASDLTAAITDYYAQMPGNTEQGWSRLTTRFQTGIAQNPEYYERFWGGIQRVETTDVTAEPPDTVEATITYHFKDGTVSIERTAFTLVQDGASLKIDNSIVLSSQTP